jgi:monoamine oxidase/SAM-dependent methyltransferase
MNNEARLSSPNEAVDGWAKKFRVAIVGGGPGGLFTAWHLEAKAGDACEIKIFEQSDRVGGKIVTRQISGIGPYEAGVAEIYDYSRLGPDPLHDLIVNDLGLEVKYLAGGPCVLDGKIITTVDDLAQHFGKQTCGQAKQFRDRCAEMLTPEAYYLSVADADNAHPWQKLQGDELLAAEISDETARRYVRVMANSDVAAGPHQTNGLTFLKNAVMDIDGYMDIFSVIGGNEQIVHGLVEDIGAEIQTNAFVRAIQPLADGSYRLDMIVNGVVETTIADFVVVALPLSAMSMIHWRSNALQEAIDKHLAYFDRPGHYLRVTLVFKRPFWREHLQSDWWMLDAFDGCCVYDESARNDVGGWGVLAFLIAGNAALALANVSDERIEQMCLEALPPVLADACDLIVDRRIHRWMASVNAMPGGARARPRAKNHRPDPLNSPGLVVVGDYLFDATLNGVLDSADAGTDIILSEVLKSRHARRQEAIGASAAMPEAFAATMEEAFEQFFSADALAEMLGVVFGLRKGARILHFGSASGRMVAALRRLGYDAVGIEWDKALHAATPNEIEDNNLHGEPTDLPFATQAFDVVIDSGLYRLAPQAVPNAIEEIWRLARQGMFLGSVTIDLPVDLLERYDLIRSAKALGSRWDWSDRLHAAGFVHPLMESPRLDEVWKRAVSAGAGPGHWCEDAESLLYSFYQRNAKPGLAAGRGKLEPTADGACLMVEQ